MINREQNLIYFTCTTREAISKLNDRPPSMTLFVVDEDNRLKGALTDGDVRRGLLAGKDISQPVSDFMQKNIRFLDKGNYSVEDIRKLRKEEIFLIPVLDKEKKIIDIFDLEKLISVLPLDAVIMAGGMGTRLRPMTDSLPKPLLKVGDKPIIEHNIDRLIKFGIKNIYISVKYLGEKIIDYFGDGSTKGINIHYIEEKEPLGTLGAVSLVQNFSNPDILVMNSDILTNLDYEDFFLDYHSSGAEMSVATVPYTVKIPYGIMDVQGKNILGLREKPSFTYYSNAGIYLMSQAARDLIPHNQPYNATDLMEDLIKNKKKLVNYPILSYWLDIGKPADFQKAIEDIKHLNLL